jgi:hypothetical protein
MKAAQEAKYLSTCVVTQQLIDNNALLIMTEEF